MIELKGCAKSIEGIIQKEREAQWKTWTSQGQISITINISQSNESIAFQLYWLNNMEFVSLYRLVTGVGLISQGLAAAALAPLKSGLRAMSSLMNGPEFNAVPFCGSLGQLNNHLVTSGRIIFNFLFYIEWIKSLNQINCDICGIIEDSDGLVSKLNERYLTNCDNFTVAHIYQRKDQYLKTLIKLKSHNLNDSVKCFSQLLTQTSLPVDIKVFSIIQNINALLEVRDSLSHDDDSYGHTMVTIQNLKNMLNDFMNSKEKYEHGSFLQANAEVVDMILVISLVAEPTSTKNHHKIFGVLKNLNQDEICTPFLKILTSLICSFNESSLVTADERLQDCFKASKRLGKSYNDNVLRVAISKGEMYLLEKKGAPAAEIEEIKFRIMEIEKTQSNKTQRNRS
ncbi:hypothetical protein PSN45_001929 [Yamadazyma tenuis]|nr:hypothetical protein PSN45_001929 [Yamadazyma tenuis]